jgi:parallel beta helix pectate lyase-like protein
MRYHRIACGRPLLAFLLAFALLALLLLFFFPSNVARAATPIYVRTDGNDVNCSGSADVAWPGGGPGLACAKKTVQAGVTAVDSGGTVIIRGGTYNSTNVTIEKNVSLLGDGASATILDGGSTGSASVITITAGFTANISAMTIQHGWGDAGGGIYVYGGTLLLSNSIVYNNNANSNGGGIYNEIGSTAIVSDTTIISNNGDIGGGITNNGNITIIASTIFNNHAASSGTSEGGGMRNNGTATLTNVTISGNEANALGGGLIVSTASTATLNNVTISSNEAGIIGGSGGGVWFGDATVNLRNTIIAGNFDATSGSVDCFTSAQFNSLGYNLVGISTSCSITQTTGDQFGDSGTPIDPHLAALADNGGPTMTHALLANSPARDAGNPAIPGSGGNACAATDQRGYPRPAGGSGGRCDIGAFEYTMRLFLPLIRR